MANNLLYRSLRFVNTPLNAQRASEIPSNAAQFRTGQGGAALTPVGIGLQTTNLEQSLPSWTLLDQSEQPRTPQLQMFIGGGYGDGTTFFGDGGNGRHSIEIITPSLNSNGVASEIHGEATLADLAVGWTAVPPP